MSATEGASQRKTESAVWLCARSPSRASSFDQSSKPHTDVAPSPSPSSSRSLLSNKSSVVEGTVEGNKHVAFVMQERELRPFPSAHPTRTPKCSPCNPSAYHRDNCVNRSLTIVQARTVRRTAGVGASSASRVRPHHSLDPPSAFARAVERDGRAWQTQRQESTRGRCLARAGAVPVRARV